MQMDQQATIELLCDCLSVKSGALLDSKLTPLSASDWDALIQLANRHKASPLLYQQLKGLAPDTRVPASVLQELREIYLQSAIRNMHLYRELTPVLTALRDADIPVIVLKGARLAEIVYDNIALRPMGDVDLLVPKNHLQRAADTLTALGYEPLKPYSIDVDVAVLHHLTPFIKPNGIKIEIHWTITRPNQHYTIAVDELWERAVPIQIAGIDVLGLCPEDLLLHLCVHTSYQHQFAFGLRPSCDIAQVIHHYGEALDWEIVLQRSATWGWERGVYLAWRVAQELVEAAVPREVLCQLKPPTFEEEIVVTAKNQLFADRTTMRSVGRKLAQLMGRGNLWASLRDFYQSVFVPQVVLAKQYSVSPDSPKIYLYYLLRFKDVLVRHGRTAWRLQRDDPEIAPLAGWTRDLSEWLSDT